MNKSLLAALLAAAIAAPAQAALKTQDVEYKHNGVAFKGYIAYDNANEGKLPGVLVVHEWWGHNAHARKQAERLAALGYVGFAIDMYGEGKNAAHPADAGEMATAVRSQPEVAFQRFDAARKFLINHDKVDPARIAAIGYCFGGSIVLEMARRGVPLQAVASFHGALAPLDPGAPRNVKAKILVAHGGDDAFIPDADVQAFKKEMAGANADLEFLVLEGAKHSFTNPDAGKMGVEGTAYNKEADEKSWAAMTRLFQQVFQK